MSRHAGSGAATDTGRLRERRSRAARRVPWPRSPRPHWLSMRLGGPTPTGRHRTVPASLPGWCVSFALVAVAGAVATITFWLTWSQARTSTSWTCSDGGDARPELDQVLAHHELERDGRLEVAVPGAPLAWRAAAGTWNLPSSTNDLIVDSRARACAGSPSPRCSPVTRGRGSWWRHRWCRWSTPARRATVPRDVGVGDIPVGLPSDVRDGAGATRRSRARRRAHRGSRTRPRCPSPRP